MDLQLRACAALEDLASAPPSTVNDATRSEIASAGGISAVVTSMQEHTEHVDVQEQGCAALWKLARNMDNHPLICTAGGIKAAVSTFCLTRV